MATAALLVLGALSGLTLAVYWVWAAPMITERVALPAVKRPSMRIAAPLPKVLEPAIEGLGDRIPMPDPAESEAEGDSGPARPVTVAPASIQSVWVVQVGAFADDARANVLVGQLAARGFTAFKSTRTMRSGTPLRVVLVGPFASRPAAAAALDKIEEMPGVGEPILQLVPPASFRPLPE
jgi:cell division septation protein DedD